MIIKRFSILAVIGITLLLVSCAQDPNLEFIQGTWHFNHQDTRLAIDHLPANDVEYWHFENYTFRKWNCCIHFDQENGDFRVISSEGDVLIIELYNCVGSAFGSDDRQYEIKIDRENDTIYFNRQDYIRGYP